MSTYTIPYSKNCHYGNAFHQEVRPPYGVLTLDVEIGGSKAKKRVNVAKDLNGKVMKVKPEYEDIKKMTKKPRCPLAKYIR